MSETGIVIIGRNEGQRLARALESVSGCGHTVVYVDSHSTDGSVELAGRMNATVVELDRSRPTTAARARNEGFERLLEIDPQVRLVQFVDGDCEVFDGWLSQASALLTERPEVAVVCGRLRERFPERSVYNRLADLEWDGPCGEIQSCGGVAMIRASTFQEVGGFDPSIIAAEDDELCLRIRRLGGKIVRISTPMASHDMAMERFGQWWKRSVRTGHAYAEGSALHGKTPERHFVRQTRSIFLWGIVLPLLTVAMAWPTRGLSLALLGGYLLLYQRTRRYYVVQRGWPAADARLYAFWIVLAKFPQAVGLLRYRLGRLADRPSPVIEHRSTVPAGDSAAG
jgi:GT2 family glycosyltransferase